MDASWLVKIVCLEEINEFFSVTEFEKFQNYIERLINDGKLVEVLVQKPYADFPEQWYQCKLCSQVWRLVHPDFPFKGYRRL
ncbi:hypothetical protein EHE19_009540 [Ruminiclostridium herbifermentans]|uniref:Uncharacterized protein n=1 Tax=Ruminiclostridium herbifermentans TaxID=2488810 RepID=A0A7H1VT99_9FIRM|nr:hypothetical protein EHE19_009540 [Ruminiclostridium herbifermentans]